MKTSTQPTAHRSIGRTLLKASAVVTGLLIGAVFGSAAGPLGGAVGAIAGAWFALEAMKG